jgi:hypothetical protein
LQRLHFVEAKAVREDVNDGLANQQTLKMAHIPSVLKLLLCVSERPVNKPLILATASGFNPGVRGAGSPVSGSSGCSILQRNEFRVGKEGRTGAAKRLRQAGSGRLKIVVTFWRSLVIYGVVQAQAGADAATLVEALTLTGIIQGTLP